MTTNRYTVGTLVRIKGSITTVEGSTPIDPTDISLELELPDGTLVDLTPGIVHDGTGLYHADYTPTSLTGLYQYEWAATGTAVVASVGSFIVNKGLPS
jgi:hypothetical protein